jgi:hypothetical protein
VTPLENFSSFHLKKSLRCFDDYMNSVVEGMDLAAKKKADMSTKPKDMDTAAD